MWSLEPTTDDPGWIGLSLCFLLDRQSRDWFQQAPPAPGGREGHQGDDLQKFRWFLLWLLQVAAIQGKPRCAKAQ